MGRCRGDLVTNPGLFPDLVVLENKISETILGCGNIGWNEERKESYRYNETFCKESCRVYAICVSEIETLNSLTRGMASR